MRSRDNDKSGIRGLMSVVMGKKLGEYDVKIQEDHISGFHSNRGELCLKITNFFKKRSNP